MRLDGKIAIITGGGSGFGEGIAHRFVEEGAKVVVADVNGDAAARVAGDIGGQHARPCTVDVAKDADVAAMVKAAVDGFGRLDIIVNNAGITHTKGQFLEVDEATFDRVFAVNVKSIYLACRHVVPLMRKQGGGCILNIASTAGIRPRPGLTWYNSSKGAAITMTRSLAVELAGDRIRVNAINPVIGETGLTAHFMGGDTPETRAQFMATIPLGRFSTPRDIANQAVNLCSDESDFITGVCMEVDGGRCV